MSDPHPFDSPLEWPEIEAALAETGVRGELAEFDLARLRRSVRQSVASTRRHQRSQRRHFVLRAAALAASLTIAAVGLGALLDGGQGLLPADLPSVAVHMQRTADGAVHFEFLDGRAVHRVVKSKRPAGGEQDVVLVARGRKFTDHNGELQPGSAVFYKFQ
ncbi:MAG: hypothetical protein JSV80_02345 [Acidobacteriota bacterium]|nr:MAG: hypothetical protein JSV80_02345 [Acidobacteriota bacterium]